MSRFRIIVDMGHIFVPSVRKVIFLAEINLKICSSLSAFSRTEKYQTRYSKEKH